MESTIDIICPLYNAENYIENQLKQIVNQTIYNQVLNIKYIITESSDNTLNIVQKLKEENAKISFVVIKRKEFSHSLTREKEVENSNADIVVFITQDVIIEKNDWLEKLVEPIQNEEVAATYSRQICNDKTSIEFYTRQKNYPEKSMIKSKSDIEEMGMKAFFFSDASSAINRKIFNDIGGYDKKNLPTNEDMYIAYKLLMNEYKIKYCADSEVIHSHNFSFKETYKRYKSYGEFLKVEPQINIKSTKAGGGLAKFILKEAIKDRNLKVIVKFVPDMLARFIGMQIGKK